MSAENEQEAALLGRIAVRYRFITMEQLAEATRERGRQGRKLGSVLLEKGWIDEFQLGKILALQQRHHDEAKAAPSRTPPSRKRIPTPKDWVFEELLDNAENTGKKGRRDTTPDRKAVLPGSRHATPAAGLPAITTSRRATDRPMPTRKARQHDPYKRTAAGSRNLESAPPTEREMLPPTSVVVKTIETLPPATQIDTSPPSSNARDTDPAGPRFTPVSRMDRAPRTTHPSRRAVRPSAPKVESVPLEPRPKGPPRTPSPRVAHLHRMLRHAALERASDIHIHAGVVAKMRQLGKLVPLTDKPLSPDATESALREMLTPWQLGELDDSGDVGLSYTVDGVGRFRVNVYRQHLGYNGVFHFVPPEPPTLAELGLPSALAKLTNYGTGLVLLTGGAGSGKTSTMAALLNIINEERSDHILTIEDPIEYVHRSKRCLVNQRQVGRHTTSFARGLQSALREDPDIISIGALHSPEAIALALSAAETGHLVLATWHTDNPIAAIEGLIGSHPAPQQAQVRATLGTTLRAVLSQKLVLSADGGDVKPQIELLYVDAAASELIAEERCAELGELIKRNNFEED
jgi:twitching motility protein PilT